MQECVAKQKNRCIWLTKENKDELLKIQEPHIYNNSQQFQIIETDEYICIDYCGAHKTFYYYNHWYVDECGDYEYPGFRIFTNKEFNETYDICN
jgi:hypothetical protein